MPHLLAPRLITLALAAAILAAPQAQAAISFTESMTARPDSSAFSVLALPSADLGDSNFSLGAVKISFATKPGEGVVKGSKDGLYAAPVTGANGALYAGNYLSTGEGGIALGFTTPQTRIAFLWGSIDAGNTLKFYDDGALIGAVTGSDIIAAPSGNQGFGGSEYVTLTSTESFNDVTLTSDTPSFEAVVYVAKATPITPVVNSVPEPASLSVLALGMVGIAAIRKRRLSR